MSEMLVTLTVGQLEELVRKAVRAEVEQTRAADVMTRDEVAIFLRVTDRTVTEYVRHHGLPAHKVAGGEWRFFRVDVVAWVKAHPAVALKAAG